MRKNIAGEPKWLWVLVLLVSGLIVLGIVMLPPVLQYDYAAPRTPAGLYIMSLITLSLLVGVLIALALQRFERVMIILFVAFRIGETAWEYELGRHSLWYLIISVFIHLLVGSAVLIFLSGHIERRER